MAGRQGRHFSKRPAASTRLPVTGSGPISPAISDGKIPTTHSLSPKIKTNARIYVGRRAVGTIVPHKGPARMARARSNWELRKTDWLWIRVA